MTEEVIPLSKDTYDTVKAMLESSDRENMTVGLSCIENADFKVNITYILLLMRQSNILDKDWEKYAPTTYESFQKLNTTNLKKKTTWTYKDIIHIMRLYEVPQEDYNFFMNKYANDLVGELNKHFGFEDNKIETVKISMKNES